MLLRGIAAKIFGLAVVLLLLTIGLVTMLVSQVAESRAQTQALLEHDMPVQASIARLEEAGLRRRLAFERWFGALNRDPPNPEIVEEASRNYGIYSERLEKELALLQRLIAAAPPGAIRREMTIEVGVLLEQIVATYPVVTQRQMELIELQRQGRRDEANARIGNLNDLQSGLQRQRERLLEVGAEAASKAGQALALRQHDTHRITIAASAAAVLLGLALAALVTLRLTEPVRALTRAVDAVRGGDLGVGLPIASRDEIGTLTEAFNYFIDELKAKERIRRTFGHYLDPRVVEHLLASDGAAMAVGERRRMTIQFADIVGFTDLSERLTPSLMVKVLNRHFALQAEAIQSQRGVVDKFLGDAVLAFWGAPFVEAEQQVRLAMRSVLAQLAAMDALRAELPELTGLRRDTPSISLRIGLATGEVLVGSIGSETTRGFTVIGDTVNLASRIESINRLYGTQVLMGHVTAAALEGEFEAREVDTVAVKGKREATRLFELLGRQGEVDGARQAAYAAYARGLAAYRAGDWPAAAAGFSECLVALPDDGPSRLMLARIAELGAGPPPEGWNGTWVFDAK